MTRSRVGAGGGVVGQGWRFARGLRGLLAHPLTVDDARREVARAWRTRNERFLDNLDALVWSHEDSPYRKLLIHAGVEPGDVRDLVMRPDGGGGVETALEALRDAGVYVAYEEYLGKVPAKRGSTVFEFRPPDFANPRVRADYMATSGGTTSNGTASGSTFADRRRRAARSLVHLDTCGAAGVPTAVWLPALPGSAGMGSVLAQTACGNPPERWFSQTRPGGSDLVLRKRVANTMLPVVARAFGGAVPRPTYTPTSEPGAVLDWCTDALTRGGHRHGHRHRHRQRQAALLIAYPSSAVAVATLATERGVSLEGLSMRVSGEPVTAARIAAIEASGARPLHAYAFSPAGTIAYGCTHREPHLMHLCDSAIAAVTRRRTRADGVEVDALCWTTLSPDTGQLLLNTENDDYGRLTIDPDADADVCGCVFGELGARRTLSDVRGMSKVVAGGVTVGGDLFERLVEDVLPRRFGGGPGHFQFAEEEDGGRPAIVLRVSPRLARNADDTELVDAVVASLRQDELGRLATDVWSPTNAIRVERVEPTPARSGKTLPFQTLRRS